MTKDNKIIGVVGPCAAGKTTLVCKLIALGYKVRHIAQEHSYSQKMWRKIANPDILIYLEVSYPKTIERKNLGWTEGEYLIQLSRLADAYLNADLIINTDSHQPEDILLIVLTYLRKSQIFPGNY